MSQKIEIRKDKIDLPIKDDLDKIHYLSTLSDKRFQNKLSHINDNLDKITKKIKEFVELLSEESRKNDEYISEKIYESLQEIFKIAKKDTEIDFNKLKQKIIKQFDKHLTISKNNKIKTEIEKYIEENISKDFSTPSNQNNQTTPNKKSSTTYTQKTINVKLSKKDTKQIYSNILTNSVFINKINKKIKDTCTTVLNDLKIKNVSKSNLKASKTNKLVLRTFLTNYNSKVEKTIERTKKSIDKETTKTRTVNDVIRSKIKRVVQKVKRFTMKINPINWYKKARNKLRNLKRRFGSFWGTTFFIVGVPIFLFKMVGKITSFITSIAFKIANVVAKIAFKLLAIVAKLALKVITKVLKTALLILKGVFKIVTKTLGLVFSIIKKVFNIAKGITKFVVKTVSKFLKPLKYLKYLLLTPQGMYVVGLICGFLVKKITGYILFLGGNAKNGLSNLGIMIKKGINKTIEKIKEKINNIAIKIGKKLLKRHNELQDKDLTLSKDSFGVPKINDKNNFIKIKEKIELKILNWFSNYIEIISKENSFDEKSNNLKEQIKNDYNTSGLKKFVEKIKNYSVDDIFRTYKDLSIKLTKMMKNDTLRQIEVYMATTGTGIISNEINKAILPKAAGYAISGVSVLAGRLIGAAIGSIGGPIGAIVGGAIGGIIGSIVENTMSKKMKVLLSTKELTSVDDIIWGQKNTYGQSSGANAKIFEIDSNYRKRLRMGTSRQDARDKKRKELNAALKQEKPSIKNPTIKQLNANRNLYYKINDEKINNISDEGILLHNTGSIVAYINEGVSLPSLSDKGSISKIYKDYHQIKKYLDEYVGLKRLAYKKYIQDISSNINSNKARQRLGSRIDNIKKLGEQVVGRTETRLPNGTIYHRAYPLNFFIRKIDDTSQWIPGPIGLWHSGQYEKNHRRIDFSEDTFNAAKNTIVKYFNSETLSSNIKFESVMSKIREKIINDHGRNSKEHILFEKVITKYWTGIKSRIITMFADEKSEDEIRKTIYEEIDKLYDEEKKHIEALEKALEKEEQENISKFNSLYGANNLSSLNTYEKAKNAMILTSSQLERERMFLSDELKDCFQETIKLLSDTTSHYNDLMEYIEINNHVVTVEKVNDKEDPNNASD